MIEIGKIQQLQVIRQAEEGWYLGENGGDEVLLAHKPALKNLRPGKPVEVFVYNDRDGKLLATTRKPEITLGGFALLHVKTVAEGVGAFLDWGIEKDLLVPFNQQKVKMEAGRWYVVFLDIDTTTNRLYASSKIQDFVSNEHLLVKEGDRVDLLVWKKTEMGFSVIVNNMHTGLLYKNEIFRQPEIGDQLEGYVRTIRDDNKLDITLQPSGYEKSIDANAGAVLQALKQNKGYLPVTDKSDPDVIYDRFGISKKAFKKAVGSLYKQRKITILANGIKMV